MLLYGSFKWQNAVSPPYASLSTATSILTFHCAKLYDVSSQWSTFTNTPTSGADHSLVPPLLLTINTIPVQFNSLPGAWLYSRVRVIQCCCVCVMKFPGANAEHPDMPFRVWILQRQCSRWRIVNGFRIKEFQAYSLVFVTVTTPVCQIMSSNKLCCARKHTACSIRRTRQTSASIRSVARFTSYWPLPYHV